MKVYVGQTRSRKLIDHLTALGFGEMAVRDSLPPRRLPWALDNGAFSDWKSGRSFNVEAWRSALARLPLFPRPDFIVAPDIVAGGDASLHFSLTWADELAGFGPVYLAVQDGMGETRVADNLTGFSGLFVGGTLPWKLKTGAKWTALAHSHGKPCHVGRVGTARRVRWARSIGADSIDSCLPLWSRENLAVFLHALDRRQGDLWATA